MSDTGEKYIEIGVFIWHGSAEVLYRTFRKQDVMDLWLNYLDTEIAKLISSVRVRQVHIQRSGWSEISASQP